MLEFIRLHAAALAAVVALGTGAWAAPQTTVNERRDAAPDMRLEIDEIIVGSITVIGWAEPSMLVTGTLGNDVTEFDIDGSPSNWEIRADWDGWDDDSDRHGRRDHDDVDVDLEIHVPFGASVEVSAVTATIKVSGVNGRIALDTVTGTVEYAGDSTDVAIDAVTGDISVKSGALRDGDFETVQGSITFTGSFDPRGSISFESVMGSIELRLPVDVAADFDVETMMGDVVNEHGPAARQEDRWMPSKELSFRTNGGGAEVSIETLQGSIRILRQ